MQAFWTMLKGNMKLVLRNKQALFLIVLIPILSTLILNLTKVDENKDPAQEFKMHVLVADASQTALSDELTILLKRNTSMIVEVLKEDVPEQKEVKEFFTQKANTSAISSFVYIPSNFETRVLNGENEDLVLLFDTGADERAELLDMNLTMALNKFSMFSKIAQGKSDVFTRLLEEAKKVETKGELVILDKKGERVSQDKKGYSFALGMFVAAITTTLIFSNTFIVGLFIKEKHNGVLKRIQLTNTSMLNYTMVKVLIAVGSLMLQTGLIMIGIRLIFKIDLGISIWIMGFLIFGLGLVLTCIGICSGVMFDNITIANYVALGFSIIANMLAGLYFPLESAPQWMQKIAMIFPQRWFVYTADKVLQGNYNVLYQYGAVIGALILFFLAISLLGFKLNRIYN